jgi:hypothetical protein
MELATKFQYSDCVGSSTENRALSKIGFPKNGALRRFFQLK